MIALSPGVTAAATCAAGAALEGLAAGGGFRERLGALRMPRHSPSTRAWMIVGVLFYLLVFLVVWRIARHPAGSLERPHSR